MLPRAGAFIAGLGEAQRQQAAEFLAGRRVKPGHPAAALLAELADAVAHGGGVLEVDPSRLPEAQRYQVSLLLHDAWDTAANDNGPEAPRNVAAAGVLGTVAADWDRVAQVSGPPSWRRHVAAGRPPGVLPKDLGA